MTPPPPQSHFTTLLAKKSQLACSSQDAPQQNASSIIFSKSPRSLSPPPKPMRRGATTTTAAAAPYLNHSNTQHQGAEQQPIWHSGMDASSENKLNARSNKRRQKRMNKGPSAAAVMRQMGLPHNQQMQGIMPFQQPRYVSSAPNELAWDETATPSVHTPMLSSPQFQNRHHPQSYHPLHNNGNSSNYRQHPGNNFFAPKPSMQMIQQQHTVLSPQPMQSYANGQAVISIYGGGSGGSGNNVTQPQQSMPYNAPPPPPQIMNQSPGGMAPQQYFGGSGGNSVMPQYGMPENGTTASGIMMYPQSMQRSSPPQQQQPEIPTPPPQESKLIVEFDSDSDDEMEKAEKNMSIEERKRELQKRLEELKRKKHEERKRKMPPVMTMQNAKPRKKARVEEQQAFSVPSLQNGGMSDGGMDMDLDPPPQPATTNIEPSSAFTATTTPGGGQARDSSFPLPEELSHITPQNVQQELSQYSQQLLDETNRADALDQQFSQLQAQLKNVQEQLNSSQQKQGKLNAFVQHLKQLQTGFKEVEEAEKKQRETQARRDQEARVAAELTATHQKASVSSAQPAPLHPSLEQIKLEKAQKLKLLRKQLEEKKKQKRIQELSQKLEEKKKQKELLEQQTEKAKNFIQLNSGGPTMRSPVATPATTKAHDAHNLAQSMKQQILQRKPKKPQQQYNVELSFSDIFRELQEFRTSYVPVSRMDIYSGFMAKHLVYEPRITKALPQQQVVSSEDSPVNPSITIHHYLSQLIGKTPSTHTGTSDRSHKKKLDDNEDPHATEDANTASRSDPVKSYESVLTNLKAYRILPQTSTEDSLHFQWNNKIDPMRPFCPYETLDASNICTDEDCPFQHLKDVSMTENEILRDLINYHPNTASQPTTFIRFKRQLGTQKTLNEIIADVKQNLQKAEVSADTTSRLIPSNFFARLHFTLRQSSEETEHASRESNFHDATQKTLAVYSMDNENSLKYYTRRQIASKSRFFEQTDSEYLRHTVKLRPKDLQSWILLALTALTEESQSAQQRNSSTKRRRGTRTSNSTTTLPPISAALSVLSDALEHNKNSEALWIVYLQFYHSSLNKECNEDELRNLLSHAILNCPFSVPLWLEWVEFETDLPQKMDTLNQGIYAFHKRLMDASSEESSHETSTLLTVFIVEKLRILCMAGPQKVDYAMRLLTEDYLDRERYPLDSIHHNFLSLIELYMSVTNQFPLSSDDGGIQLLRYIESGGFLIEWGENLEFVLTKAQDGIRSAFQNAVQRLEEDNMHDDDNDLYRKLLLVNRARFERTTGNVEKLRELCAQHGETCSEIQVEYTALLECKDMLGECVAAFEHILEKQPTNYSVWYHYMEFALRHDQGDQVPSYLLVCAKCLSTVSDSFKVEDFNNAEAPMLQRQKLAAHFDKLYDNYLEVSAWATIFFWRIYFAIKCNWGNLHDMFKLFRRASSLFAEQEADFLWIDFLFYSLHFASSAENVSEAVRLTLCHVSSTDYLMHTDLRTLDELRRGNPLLHTFVWKIFKKDKDCWNHIVQTYISTLPRNESISEVFNCCIFDTPNDSRMLHDWCQTEFKMDKWKRTLTLLAVFAKTFKMDECAWLSLIQISRMWRNTEEIRNLFEDALEAIPFSYIIW
eukprot:CAMPEP_0117435234 /NCGR_PEP_ID=MMETSP0759-20121206/371_1 /TAXON_ID=63605 /ORGANISM="Percolomonas cosmopolitus, Strain WS" /LENGTH=1617 /DNA_ID=CAMNT_0005226765 /DNA_START=69 /DNA_END=4919 /DNA_ORIENTATION=-